jgi:hypothetical protein
MSEIAWGPIAIFAGCILAAIIIGLFHASWFELFQELALRPLNMLENAVAGIRGVADWIAARVNALRERERIETDGHFAERLFGGVLYSCLTLVFVANDTHLAALFLSGQGMVEDDDLVVQLIAAVTGHEVGLSALISAGLAASYIVAGASFMDLIGVTHLLPLPETFVRRLPIWFLTLATLLVALAVSVAMGEDRAQAMATAPATEAIDPVAPIGSVGDLLAMPAVPEEGAAPVSLPVAQTVFIGHAALMFLATLLAATGLVKLAGMFLALALLAVQLLLHLLALVPLALRWLLQYPAGVLLLLVPLLLHPCRQLARPVASLLGEGQTQVHLPVGGPQPAENQQSVSNIAPVTPEKTADQPAAETWDNDGDTPRAEDDPDPDNDEATTASGDRSDRNWNPYGQDHG